MALSERLRRADRAVQAMIRANEPALRMMLASSLQRSLSGGGLPTRQNRRRPLIDARPPPPRGFFPPRYGIAWPRRSP